MWKATLSEEVNKSSISVGGLRGLLSPASAVLLSAFLLVAGFVVYFTNQEIISFKANHQRIFDTEIQGAKATIEEYLESRPRLARTFAQEKESLLNLFSADIQNSVLRDEIEQSLGVWFPAFFTFTMADLNGTILLKESDDGTADEMRGVQDYIKALAEMSNGEAYQSKIALHPQEHFFHFDLMVPWRGNNELKGVFLVSFYPEGIRQFLRSFESNGHNLFILNRDQPGLIEITSAGARDQIPNTRDTTLTSWEMENIQSRQLINPTRWEIVGVPDPDLFSAHAKLQWRNAAIVLALMASLTAFSLWTMARLATQNRLSRAALIDKTNELSASVLEMEQSKEQLEIQASNLVHLAEDQAGLRHEAESAERSKSEFLASMSHEIRTPMTGVMGFADMLLDRDLKSAEREMVEKIKGATLSLLTIINDILDLSKIEAGKFELEYLDFHLKGLMEDIVELAQQRADGKGLKLLIDVSADLPSGIHSDPTRLRQVLMNLIGNAVKFTHGGSVTVRAVLDQGDGDSDEKRLMFEVTDTGIGIAEESIANLFDDFTQADASISRKYEGTGLGLAISKKLVEMMGGVIGARSTLGEGSTFYIFLPLKPSETTVVKRSKGGAATTFEAVRSLNVLVAEDNQLNQRIIAAILDKYGHTYELVENGQLAVNMADQQEFDLALMDARMPEMSGPDAARAIRKLDGAAANLPIIALSADAMQDHVRGYFEAGMNGFSAKPIDQIALLAKINEVLDEQVHIPSTVPPPEPREPQEQAPEPESDDSTEAAAQVSAVEDFLKSIDLESMGSNKQT